VERKGAETEVTGPYPYPPLVSQVQPMSAAADAGMQDGDFVLALNGTPVQAFNQMRDIVGASEGKPVTLSILRAGQPVEVVVTPKRVDLPKREGGFETRWLLGLSGRLMFDTETRVPGPLEGAWLGVKQVGNVISTSLSGLGHMVAGQISTCNMQGPIGIAKTSGAAASMGLSSFIGFIAMLSTAVGMMNLFPIPVLDGGHLLFHAYEAVMRRPPSDGAMRLLMTIGLTLLLGMMLFALRNDIFCP
jgi:regulator of sigma E protease